MSRTTLHGQLLEQALHLATRDRTRPKNANLRRAISSAYYALFHLLIQEATERFLPARTTEGRIHALRKTLSRSLTHNDMKKTSRLFAGLDKSWPVWLGPLVGKPADIPAEVRALARAFVHLQEARHEADHNTTRAFTRQEVRLFIDEASAAERD